MNTQHTSVGFELECILLCCVFQLCYDASDGGADFREQVSVNLAWWHTYRHACHVVWNFFSRDVFAPLFHHLFPGQQFHEHPKTLSVVVSLFQIVKLAYGSFLEAQVTEVRSTGCPPAADFTFLCENAIPAVLACALAFENMQETSDIKEFGFEVQTQVINNNEFSFENQFES